MKSLAQGAPWSRCRDPRRSRARPGTPLLVPQVWLSHPRALMQGPSSLLLPVDQHLWRRVEVPASAVRVGSYHVASDTVYV